MLTLSSTPELEGRLQAEAAKRGLEAEEFVLRLLEEFATPHPGGDAAEAARLMAIDELMGAAAISSFGTEELHQERQRERDGEEERFLRHFDKGQAA